MRWLKWRAPRPAGTPHDRGEDAPEDEARSRERKAPGISALFEDLRPDRCLTVLDLGPASEGSLRFYSRFARRVRFVDMERARAQEESPASVVDSLRRYGEFPYDLVLTWEHLHRLSPLQRDDVIERLVSVTAPGTRLHAMIDMSGDAMVPPRRFTLVGEGRLRETVGGSLRPAPGRVLPAEVDRFLAPFRVVSAYVLRDGLREYVAMRT